MNRTQIIVLSAWHSWLRNSTGGKSYMIVIIRLATIGRLTMYTDNR